MERYFAKRFGITNLGYEYENLNIASIVLNLVSDTNIKDFHISSKDENFGDFDDIVVEIEREDKSQVYAIQLKYSDRKRLVLEKLKNQRRDFSISKYFNSFRNIRRKETELILFTNQSFNVQENTHFQLDGENFNIALSKSCPRDIISTSQEEGCCYTFRIVEDCNFQRDERIQEYKRFFEKFCLYVDQDNLADLKINLVNRFKKMFAAADTEFDKYLEFIREWSMQEGKKEKLNKLWMQRAIALQLLSPRIKPLTFNLVNDKTNVLREAISTFNVTVFEEESYDKVRQIWGDVRNEMTDIKEMNKLRKKYQLDTKHIKSVYDVDENLMTKLLWLTGKCPLILTEDAIVEKVVNMCWKDKFVLLGKRLVENLKENK